MFTFKNFKAPEYRPQLVGGISHDGTRPIDCFYRNWKTEKACDGTWVVGRKDNGPHCFSIQRLGDNWDIAFYYECTPKEVRQALKEGKSTFSACAEYYESDPKHKYLALDLIKILQADNIEI